MTDFPASLTIALRWRDMDELGHLTHSVYHDFLAEGRVALMPMDGGGFPFVLVRTEVDHRHEVRRADGHVTVLSAVEHIGRSSLTTRQEVRLPDGTLAAECLATLVGWDAEARASRPLTDAEREHLQARRASA